MNRTQGAYNKENKITDDLKGHHMTHLHAQVLRGSRSVSHPYRWSHFAGSTLLPCTITIFVPVSLPLSSPGDV